MNLLEARSIIRKYGYELAEVTELPKQHIDVYVN
jgi:hypothetical protein